MVMIASLSVSALALAVPSWITLSLIVPVLIVLSSYMAIIPPLFSSASTDIEVFDVVILIVFLKMSFNMLRLNFPLQVKRLFNVISIYLGVLLFSTLIAAFRFGEDVFMGELISFLRFLMQFAVFLLLFYSITAVRDIRRLYSILHFIGYSIGISVYASIALYQFLGVKFGEVIDAGTLVRYFGPIGDQVGFVLSLFCFKEFVSGRMLPSLFFAGAVLATGTRGAVIALAVGLSVLLFRQLKNYRFNRLTIKQLSFVFSLVLLVVIVGGVTVARFKGDILSQTYIQRAISMSIAINVFQDNLLMGVGFNGFHFFTEPYEGLFKKFSQNYVANANNQYLQVATDAGIIGLIAFFFLLERFLHILKLAGEDNEPWFTSGRAWLISLLVGNQAAVWLNPGSLVSYFLWMLLAIAAAKVRLESMERPRWIEST